MKERPILFSGPMVRAILDGRKTQTRRPVKPQPFVATPSMFDLSKCPIGQPGDRLWVRETWQLCDYDGPGGYPKTDSVYRADGETDDKRKGWRPSIHMPRSASRITLEIARVWVERVQDITEDGAIREGMVRVDRCSPFQMFRDTWQSIYGTWDANPFVWAVEFRRTK
jgi:hypothetical protein